MKMADKIELDLVSNLSETNSISASVSTFDDTNSRINLFRRESEGSIQFSQVTVNPVVCNCKSRCCSKTVFLVLLHILIMLISMAAIALSVWMVIYYFEIVKEQQSDMQQLVERITALENTTSRENQTEIEIQMLLPNISDMVESNSMVIQTLNKTLIRLENQMSEISMQLNRDLRGNVSQLTIDINSNLGSIRTLSGFLTDLDGKIQQVQNELITATNTTINPFEGCVVSHEMCQGTEMNNIYWRECSTPYTALNVTGYTTADMWCDYESNYPGNMIATALHKHSTNDEVRCKCSILLPDNFRDNFFPLPINFVFTCNLHILRCPVH